MLFKTETLATTSTSKSRATEMRWGSWLLWTFSLSWKSLLAKIVFNIIIRFSVNLSMIIPANFRSLVNTRWRCRMEESKRWRTVSGQRLDMWWVLQFNFETTSKVFFGLIENYLRYLPRHDISLIQNLWFFVAMDFNQILSQAEVTYTGEASFGPGVGGGGGAQAEYGAGK